MCTVLGLLDITLNILGKHVKHLMTALPFLTLLLPNQIGDQCFRVSAYTKYLEGAQERCESEGANLASITSQELQNALKELIKDKMERLESFKNVQHFWIGAHFDKYIGEWTWPHSYEKFSSYKRWLDGVEGEINSE